jgi:hypothetical protein
MVICNIDVFSKKHFHNLSNLCALMFSKYQNYPQNVWWCFQSCPWRSHISSPPIIHQPMLQTMFPFWLPNCPLRSLKICQWKNIGCIIEFNFFSKLIQIIPFTELIISLTRYNFTQHYIFLCTNIWPSFKIAQSIYLFLEINP